jgi:hypothetical protein
MKKCCPYCQSDMESGYIQCRDGISWSKQKRTIAAIQPLNKRKNPSVILATSSGPFVGSVAEAYICTKCKKVVIDYSENQQ